MGKKKNTNSQFSSLSLALELWLVLRPRQPITDALSGPASLSPAHASQSQPPLVSVHHQIAVGLAERRVVCRPMSERCGEVIMLVAISLAKQEKSETPL